MRTAVITGLALLLALCQQLPAISQEDPTGPGDIRVVQSERIERLLEKHRQINALYPEIDGYRIQIYFDSGNTSKSRAFDVYKSFMSAYPSIMAYVVYHEPNYKVRVGDFRTRIEAEGFMKRIMGEYPSAFVIKDKILFPKLDIPPPNH